MGSVDMTFAIALQRRLALWRAVETGTFLGLTARKLAKVFPNVLTIELSPELHAQADEALRELHNVEVVLGHSVEHLGSLDAGSASLYFLDGHWSAGPTDGEGDQCPVLREIEAIGAGHPDDVIIIDDARLFATAPPPPNDPAQWPSLLEVADTLRRHRPDHIITVVNDQIVAVPEGGRAALDQYGWRLQRTPWPRAKAHAVKEAALARLAVLTPPPSRRTAS